MSQIYESRSAFATTAQSALTTLLIMYGTSAGLVSLALSRVEGGNANDAMLLPEHVASLAAAAIVFFAPLLLSRRSVAKMEAGYDLYVASVIHATVVAKALQIPLAHEWLVRCDEIASQFRHGEFPRDPTELPDRRGTRTLKFVRKRCDPNMKRPRVIRPESVAELIAAWKLDGATLYWFYSDLFRYGVPIASIAGMLFAFLILYAKV